MTLCSRLNDYNYLNLEIIINHLSNLVWFRLKIIHCPIEACWKLACAENGVFIAIPNLRLYEQTQATAAADTENKDVNPVKSNHPIRRKKDGFARKQNCWGNQKFWKRFQITQTQEVSPRKRG